MTLLLAFALATLVAASSGLPHQINIQISSNEKITSLAINTVKNQTQLSVTNQKGVTTHHALKKHDFAKIVEDLKLGKSSAISLKKCERFAIDVTYLDSRGQIMLQESRCYKYGENWGKVVDSLMAISGQTSGKK